VNIVTPSREGAENVKLVEVAVTDESFVLPIGVKNGETAPLSGLVPVDVVSLGVPKAGEVTRVSADAMISAATSRLLVDLIEVAPSSL
jgi:hypothetical protein